MARSIAEKPFSLIFVALVDLPIKKMTVLRHRKQLSTETKHRRNLATVYKFIYSICVRNSCYEK